MNDPNSQLVTLLKEQDQRSFRLLENLGTNPAIYYLKGGPSHV
jgi:hypothetical protein